MIMARHTETPQRIGYLYCPLNGKNSDSTTRKGGLFYSILIFKTIST